MPRAPKRSPIIAHKTRRGIVPASAWDEEQLATFPIGTYFNVTPQTKRSNPQLNAYWKALQCVVDATGRWPTRYHLHDALRRDLGYWSMCQALDGTPYIVVDSTSFEAMTHAEFQRYMDAAMARLAEVTGMDPLAFLEAA